TSARDLVRCATASLAEDNSSCRFLFSFSAAFREMRAACSFLCTCCFALASSSTSSDFCFSSQTSTWNCFSC
ncbi:hypothetical protein LEMLEM_LOCUS715, partial [Lemmus lemmus]